MNRVLLVEPNFPIPKKSKNHKDFLPIGLLKIASYFRSIGTDVKLMRGIPEELVIETELRDFEPDEIWITSLFTYWAEYVKAAVNYYRKIYPQTKIKIGGIYASLMPRHCKEFTGCDEINKGVLAKAEKFPPAYDLIDNINSHPIDFQIIHSSRGCDKRCPFCGTWKIEPKFKPKKTIKDEIKYRKIVFYDNNFLANPYINNILDELISLKRDRTIIWCESQSGFDGRILLKQPGLASKLKQAGFRYPRIAWDWHYKDYSLIKNQIDLLINSGFRSKDIYTFVLYNWDISFEEMELKRKKCWDWNVQISDCRFRPINQTFDNYNAKKNQSNKDYYIHLNWTDEQVKKFRKNIRMQNICVRQDVLFYSKKLERKEISKERTRKLKRMRKEEIGKYLNDVWFPAEAYKK